MKVTVKKWKGPQKSNIAMDAWLLWRVGRMPGEIFRRIAIKNHREKFLYYPKDGEHCPSNGKFPGIECRCNGCPFVLSCRRK